jgi:hypothetical protein
MSTHNSNARDSVLASDEKLIAGIQKHLTAQPTLMLGSQQVPPANIVTALQGRIALGKAIEPATAVRTAAIKAYKDKRAATALLLKDFRRMVQTMFSQSPDVLADFGLEPLKTGKATVATKAAALDKSKATRTARHTMGSVQRKSVKGAVPAPATSPAQATSATTAAAQAPSPAAVPVSSK